MEYLRGERDPAEALRLIDVLPEDSATAAMMRADPDHRARRSRKPVDRWREQYGWTRAHEIAASTFDLLAAANAGKKKKPMRYPRPSSG